MARTKKPAIPQFNLTYAIPGDTITWAQDGFDITATLVADEDSRPDDCDCYTPKQIAAWKRDEWCFVGVVLSVSLNGVELDDHAASLWGIDCNFPKRGANKYLTEVALELAPEALAQARESQARILKALTPA